MDKISKYLLEHIPNRDGFFRSLEQYAEENRVPIMDPVSINFLTQLVRMKQPKEILELGTAIGYSALRMHEAYPMTTITTIERNVEMYRLAIENIEKTNKNEHIQVILGDALEVLEDLKNNHRLYDFIFIDAAKGQYQKFFSAVKTMLNKDGIIVCDNVLFKGIVVDEKKTDQVRLQKIAKKVRHFNEWLVTQNDFHTSIIPIGDGLSISVKRNDSISG